MLRKLLVISIAFTLSACAAKYAPSNDGIWSDKPGYIAIQVDSSTYRVAFSGQNMTLENTDRYAFYRAAELTLEKGFDYFVVLQNGLDERGLDAWNTIRMFKGPLPESALDSFDAREVVKYMAPYIQRGDEGANR